MKGPYTARVFLRPVREIRSTDAPDLELRWTSYYSPSGDTCELLEGDRIAGRFYRSGGGAGVLGTLRAATFYVGALLGPGEEAYVSVVDREGKSTGYDSTVRRDVARRLLSTLGSRWANERHFVGA